MENGNSEILFLMTMYILRSLSGRLGRADGICRSAFDGEGGFLLYLKGFGGFSVERTASSVAKK
ncbi:hypothetical protein VA599_16060 [Chromobacterium sp. TRC.1.1.SA]|uniref:Uncharacterized protein n=1 Tax=Chromobacterium indicum TaxID=3110228 RepID=A0ABV0CMQ1_9NEIS